MPVYEFYCKDCNTIYSFWSRRINTDKIPGCPKCPNPNLERRMSKTAVLRKIDSGEEDEFGDLPFDESKMEETLGALASEAEGLDENNPRDIAKLMRKFADKTGLRYNDKIETMLNRLESGEDPDQIEQEFGDVLDDDELPFELKGKSLKNLITRPKRDETIYDL